MIMGMMLFSVNVATYSLLPVRKCNKVNTHTHAHAHALYLPRLISFIRHIPSSFAAQPIIDHHVMHNPLDDANSAKIINLHRKDVLTLLEKDKKITRVISKIVTKNRY